VRHEQLFIVGDRYSATGMKGFSSLAKEDRLMASPKATGRQAAARPARFAVDEVGQQQSVDGSPYLGPGELRAQSDSIADTLVAATKSVEVERLVRQAVHRAAHLGSQDLETILQRVAHPGHVLMAVCLGKISAPLACPST
jgi:hypothetical protein